MEINRKIIFVKLKEFNDDEKLIDENNLKIDFLLSNFNRPIPYFKGKNLISKYDIVKEAKVIKNSLTKNKNKFAILISFANPQILIDSSDAQQSYLDQNRSNENQTNENKIKERLNETKLNKICIEFIYELYEYYKNYLKENNIEFDEIEIDEKIEKVKDFLENIFSNEKYIFDIIFYNPGRKTLSNIVQFIPDKEIEIYINPILKNLQEYKIIEDYCIQSMRRKIININTAKKFSNEWTRNFLKNSIKYIYNKGVGALIDFLKGEYPALIIGAGSSIDDNLNIIKELSKAMLVICVDTALIPILKAKINVDIVVSSDSQSINALYITCSNLIKYKKEEYPILVCMPTVHPKLIQKYKGKVIFSSMPFDLVKDIDSITFDRLEVGSGGTVSALAFEIALIMNPSEIFLVGTDFCYSNGKLHCKNALFDSIFYGKANFLYDYSTFIMKAMLKANSFITLNEFGYKVRTDPKFLMFLEWFKSQIKLNKKKDKIYFFSNKSYGLSFIKYLEKEEINQFINKKDFSNLRNKLKEIEEEVRQEEFKKIKDNYLEFLNKINLEGIFAKSMIENILKRIEGENISDSMYMYINSLEKKIKDFSGLKTLINMSFQEYLLAIQYENKDIDTISFYKNLLKKLDEILLLTGNLIEKIEKVD